MLWKWIAKPSLERSTPFPQIKIKRWHKYSLTWHNKGAAARFSAPPPPCFLMFRSILGSVWFLSAGIVRVKALRFIFKAFSTRFVYTCSLHAPFMFPCPIWSYIDTYLYISMYIYWYLFIYSDIDFCRFKLIKIDYNCFKLVLDLLLFTSSW